MKSNYLVLLLLVFTSSNILAGPLARFNLFYEQNKSTNRTAPDVGTSTDDENSSTNILTFTSVGYKFESGFYTGLRLLILKSNGKYIYRDKTNGYESSSDYQASAQAPGVELGFIGDGLLLTLSHFPDHSVKYTTSSISAESDMNFNMLELAYGFEVSSSVKLGPTLMVSDRSYGESRTTDLATDIEVTTPADDVDVSTYAELGFTLWFEF